MDERAEVALLDRNVVITGDDVSADESFAGQIIVKEGATIDAREGQELRDHVSQDVVACARERWFSSCSVALGVTRPRPQRTCERL